MTQLISCDMGRYESKFFTINNQMLKFRSVIGEWHQRNLSSGGDHDVMINGVNKFIGELALKESFLPTELTTESKIHEETLFLFLCGVGALSTDDDISIITSLPVNQFNIKGKDDLNNLLRGRHIVTFQGRRPKQIFINQISIVPEGAGTFFGEIKKRPELRNGIVRVINLGSRTTNILKIENGNYLSKGSDTFNYGTISLNNSKADPKTFSRKIIGDLSSQWHDYNDTDVVLMSGGGIIQLESYLRQHFKNSIIPSNPTFSDAIGAFDLGIAKQKQVAS